MEPTGQMKANMTPAGQTEAKMRPAAEGKRDGGLQEPEQAAASHPLMLFLGFLSSSGPEGPAWQKSPINYWQNDV